LLGAIAGCTDDPEDNPDGSIDYALDGGLAGPVATIHIAPSGKTTRTTPDGAKETATLAAAVVDDLERKVTEADFPTLDPMYGCNGCTDDSVHKISVQLGGISYAVTADDHASYPERLRPVIDVLCSITLLPLASQ
jgi:hypothetical protein